MIGSDGTVLGTVAVYYREPRAPSPHDDELIRAATHLAGIVLEKELVDRRLRQSLEAEQAARVEVERASRMKDEFLATLSHELRTPLNAILGWARIMKLKPDLPSDLGQGVDVIERNARAQATIIQDLLDMSAIISGKVRLNVQPLDLAALVLSAVETATPAAAAKQIRLTTDLGEEAATAGHRRPEPAAAGLLEPAQQRGQVHGPGGPRARRAGAHGLQLRGHASPTTARGSRRSSCRTCSTASARRDASTTRRHGGLGLGLSIVKQLVELHGGTVRAASEGVGRGATFVLALPIAALRVPAEPAVEREAPLPALVALPARRRARPRWPACACWSWTTTATRGRWCGACSRSAGPRSPPRRRWRRRCGRSGSSASTCWSATSACRAKTGTR